MIAPSASYRFTMRVEITNRPGMLGRVASAIGEAGGDIGAVDLVETSRTRVVRDITIKARDSAHAQQIVARLKRQPDARVVNVSDRTFPMHLGGKIETRNKVPLRARDDLSMAYTPGVARICLAIRDDVRRVFALTMKQNRVAVVTDGTAMLGPGDIGPEAALPVMEGKAMPGRLGDALKGADVFIGLSVPGVLGVKDLKRMGRDPVVFAMANPVPEIQPELAERQVRVLATGRSDYPNWINNVLCFPGFFRGLLDSRARTVNEEMKIAAARAIAGCVSGAELGPEYIIPSVFNKHVAPAVARAVASAAHRTGVARRRRRLDLTVF